MIQLATDPAASRTAFRPSASNDKGGSSLGQKRGRNGHAWPFLSRPVAQPAHRDSDRPTADAGS